MICKCPNCSGAVEYNPADEKMACPYCGDEFQIQDVLKEQKEETISYQVYACTSCGAEISVNKTEVSTYCAYCGQPTIVFSRVSKDRRPRFIIPFKITREQAVEKLRQKMRLGFFIPREIQNFQIEKVRGIYIPYQLYNINYYDRQKLKGKVREEECFFIREAECEFRGIACDASMRLKDDLTRCLEPYDMRELKPFDEGYLSGFYADKASVGEKSLREIAKKRAKEMFDGEVRKTIHADNVQLCKGNCKCEVIGTDYVMLPAWFLMFQYEGESYTMLVNGQTGKTVGAVPADKKKAKIVFALLFPFTTVLGIEIGTFFIKNTERGFLIFLYAIPLWIALWALGSTAMDNVKEKINQTKNKDMGMFVKKRQDKD